jgi:hypothetical protein
VQVGDDVRNVLTHSLTGTRAHTHTHTHTHTHHNTIPTHIKRVVDGAQCSGRVG